MASLCGCVQEEKSTASSTYIGGEIINPIQGYVLLRRGDIVTDSIPLDRRNRFFYELTDFKEGLYRIEHGEHQLIHIEEGDSILLRVNTADFDESLSFSGYGAAKSAFLAEMYLHWEKENIDIKREYQKNPKNFEKMLDSMAIIHKEELDAFLKTGAYSPSFIEIATAITTLDNYQRKEWYPFPHHVKDKLKFIKELPSDFYSFRKNVPINEENLTELYSFRRYLNSYINHLAFLKYGNEQDYNRTSYIHNHYKIQVIDSLITNESLKDRLLLRESQLFIANSNNSDLVQKLFTEIKEVAVSDQTLQIIDTLYENNKNMQAGQNIPEVVVMDTLAQKRTLKAIVHKPTVFYFWTYNKKGQMDNSHLKARDLERKYPEFNFIGINTNNENDKWLKYVKKNKFDVNKEYRLVQSDRALRQLMLNDINKTIVVDKNGVILNSHANLQNANFENELLAYLNQ